MFFLFFFFFFLSNRRVSNSDLKKKKMVAIRLEKKALRVVVHDLVACCYLELFFDLFYSCTSEVDFFSPLFPISNSFYFLLPRRIWIYFVLICIWADFRFGRTENLSFPLLTFIKLIFRRFLMLRVVSYRFLEIVKYVH